MSCTDPCMLIVLSAPVRRFSCARWPGSLLTNSRRVLSPDQEIRLGGNAAVLGQVCTRYFTPPGLTTYSMVGACLVIVPLVYSTRVQPGPTWDHGTPACGRAADAPALALAAPAAPAPSSPATQTALSAATRPRFQTLVNIRLSFQGGRSNQHQGRRCRRDGCGGFQPTLRSLTAIRSGAGSPCRRCQYRQSRTRLTGIS